MTLIKNHEFALSWWPIGKEDLRMPRSQKDDPGIMAWTINGASSKEIAQIKEWCRNNGAKASRPVKWLDNWHDRSGETYAEFINNEMTVITDRDTGTRMDAWLRSISHRNVAVLMEGVTLSQVKKWTVDCNARIIQDLFEPRYIASIDDDELAVELALRSD